MLIKQAADIATREITPRALYLRRREFLAASVAAGGAAISLACFGGEDAQAERAKRYSGAGAPAGKVLNPKPK